MKWKLHQQGLRIAFGDGCEISEIWDQDGSSASKQPFGGINIYT
jgi:hypothetical protein